MLRFLRRLFAGSSDSRTRPAVTARGARSAPSGAAPAEPRPALPQRARKPAPSRANLDREDLLEVHLVDWEEDVLFRVAQRIDRGQFEVPRLAAAHVRAMELAATPSVEVRALVEAITTDPVLSSDLLRLANSAAYAASTPAQTLQEAIVRIGMRGLRSLLLGASLRGIVLRTRDLESFATEVWRQASSMAAIARAISADVGFESDHALMLGLLHDVGKVPLLGLLRDELPGDKRATQAMVGRVFVDHHERAGVALARAWKLPEEIVSVVGRHHRFAENVDFPRSAALASLVHRMDLLLSMGADHEFKDLLHASEFELLGVPEGSRYRALGSALSTFELHEAAAETTRSAA